MCVSRSLDSEEQSRIPDLKLLQSLNGSMAYNKLPYEELKGGFSRCLDEVQV